VLHYVPALKHTYLSEVNLSRIPSSVPVVFNAGGTIKRSETKIRQDNGDCWKVPSLRWQSSRMVDFTPREYLDDPAVTADLVALLARRLETNRLAGFVIEGTTPYGKMTSSVRQRVLRKAIYSGLPVVRVGRGNPEGFADRMSTSSRARI